MPEQQADQELSHRYDEPYEEIDLADVVLAIWRRRWLFVITCLVVFGLSAAYAFLVTSTYEYRAILEIGSVPNGLSERQIESAEIVKDRIERLYIPSVLHELRNEYEDSISRDSIKVAVPEQSGIVTLSREAPDSEAGRTLDLLNRIVRRVEQDHDRTFELVASEHEEKLTNARNALAGLKSRESLIQADMERVNQSAELVKANIESLEASLQRMEAQRDQVTTGASNEGKAMTLLLIDSQIQSDQRRLEHLRERLDVVLEKERDQLEDQLGDNQRAQDNQKQAIMSLEARGQAMQRTRAVIPPTQSQKPVSPNKRLVLVLGFAMAGMLGVLAVGVSGLVAAARRKMAAEQPSHE